VSKQAIAGPTYRLLQWIFETIEKMKSTYLSSINWSNIIMAKRRENDSPLQKNDWENRPIIFGLNVYNSAKMSQIAQLSIFRMKISMNRQRFRWRYK
jgi:hypothetical protein